VIGSVAQLLRFAHFVLPGVSRNVTAKVVNAYLEKAETTPETSGNLFSPAKYGTSIYGGWNKSSDQASRKKNMITAVAVAGIATAMTIFGVVKLRRKSF